MKTQARKAMEGMACQDSLRIIFDGAAEFVMLLDHSGIRKLRPGLLAQPNHR